MKNVIKRVSLSVLFLALFTDCNKELELRPLGQLDENTFYQSEADFEAASLSPYSTLLGIYWSQDGNGNFNTVLMPDDDMVPGGTGADAQEDFNWTASNGQFSFVWGECYKGIQRANVIIDRLPDAKKFKDEVKKARFEAEAKFLRAYFHFQLALHFGTPPVSTSTISTVEESRKPNSKPGEIWDLVISDLQFAKQNLPESYDASNLGRVTKWAATALLGKVYLYRAQWDKNDALYANAATEFSAVVASGKFSLVPKYADNFAENTENNAESIFEIQMSRGDFNPWLATDFGLDGDQNVGSAGTARLILFRPSCGPTNVCEPGGSGGLATGEPT